MKEMISNIITTGQPKIKRKKFFLYSGAMVIGLYTVLKNPFRLVGKKTPPTDFIKIRPNPNAVKRNQKEVNNG